MKNMNHVVVAALILLLVTDGGVSARGGRGGGRGGFSGGGRSPSMSRPSISRPSPSMSRPSMSRPSPSISRPSPSISRPSPSVSRPTRPSTPSRPSTGQRPGGGLGQQPGIGQRPGGGQLPGGSRPGTGQRPGLGQSPGGQRPGVGQRPTNNDLKNFLDLPGRPSTLPANPGNRLPAAGNRPGNRPGVVPAARPGNVNIGNSININRGQINQQINQRYHAGNRPFGPNWWGRHPATRPVGRYHHWYHYHGRYPGGYWWRRATAVAITGWVAYRWASPIYYGYGDGGNVYYENNTVYVDGNEYCSSREYYDEAATIAQSVPEISDAQAEEIEWMPLGVFALTQEGVNDSNMLLQLAVSKEGVIAGTLFNESTETSRPVEGTVDKETQRAAWSPVDGQNADVVMETGIYNLTEDQATALVHFGPDKTQTWVMVRLDEPEDDSVQ